MKHKRKKKHLETTRSPKVARMSGEFEKTQGNPPEPEAHVVVGENNQTPGEQPPVLECFSRASSPGKCRAAAEDGGGGGGIPQVHQVVPHTEHLEVTQPQVLEEQEAPSVSTEDSFPPYLGMAGVKIYYRRVQMKRGVAESWDDVEVYEPASKKTKRESVFSEEAEQASDIWSRLSTRELIDVSDYSEASEEREQAGSVGEPPAQEREQAGSAGEPPAQEREQAGSAGEPPAQEEIPRAETPEWLVALDSGFRCLGCCRVFPSVEVLQDHVDNAVREGFSCQVFHRILAWLNDNSKEKEEEEENHARLCRW
ncbi:protein FAM170A-like [Manis javanica]|uniref:protein FAM170A-like n=1 Tax=Manis javanica TaxID=9974 RepID=UPI003C6CCC5A